MRVVVRLSEDLQLPGATMEREMQSLARVTWLELPRGSIESLASSLAASLSSRAATRARPRQAPGVQVAGHAAASTGQGASQAPDEAPGRRDIDQEEGVEGPWTRHMQTLLLDSVLMDLPSTGDAAWACPLLTSLTCRLSGDDAKALPSWIGELPQLLTLTLAGHSQQLRGYRAGYRARYRVAGIPMALHNICLAMSLRGLHLDTLFVQSLPDTLDGLVELTELRLSRLPLTSLPETLGNLPRLQHLLIHGCDDLISLPRRLTDLRLLSSLHVSNCFGLESTQGAIPPILGRHLQNSLRSLRFMGTLNRLPSWHPPADLSQCMGLEALCLSSSECTDIAISLGMLSKLRTLKLQMLRLRSLPDVFGQLGSLTQFIMLSEVLEEIPPSLAGAEGPSKLKTLGLFSPALRRLPPGFGTTCRGLGELVLGGLFSINRRGLSRDPAGCQIQSLPESASCLVGLKVLCISSTRFPFMPVLAAQHLRSLEELRIQYTEGETQDRAAFIRHLPALQSLALKSKSMRPNAYEGLL